MTVRDSKMRMLNERVAQWSCGRYFMTWQGDELLLKATNDEDAIKEGQALLEELEAYEAKHE
jgi:hypothetical protein